MIRVTILEYWVIEGLLFSQGLDFVVGVSLLVSCPVNLAFWVLFCTRFMCRCFDGCIRDESDLWLFDFLRNLILCGFVEIWN